MHRDTELALLRRAFARIDSGTTDLSDAVYHHAARAYVCPDRAARESEQLFRRLPIVVGLSRQLAEPGAFFCDELSGVPILVTRAEDGRVRAFLNVCRHRAARVASGTGQARSFSCPYHGWTYALDGSLRGLPDDRSFPGVDRAEHGLLALPTLERHGLIWARLSVDPDSAGEPDIATYLGGLDDELAHYRIGDFHRHDSREIRIRANWKLALDTFLEPYHLGVLHRKTVARLIIDNLCLFDAFEQHLRVAFLRHTIHDERKRPEPEQDFKRQTAVVYVLFPNTVLIWQLDHIEIWRIFPVPGKVDECRMVLEFLVPEPAQTESARKHWQRNLDVTIATVLEEDFPTMEQISSGLLAGGPSRLVFGRNEPALAHFERTVTEWVERPAPS